MNPIIGLFGLSALAAVLASPTSLTSPTSPASIHPLDTSFHDDRPAHDFPWLISNDECYDAYKSTRDGQTASLRTQALCLGNLLADEMGRRTGRKRIFTEDLCLKVAAFMSRTSEAIGYDALDSIETQRKIASKAIIEYCRKVNDEFFDETAAKTPAPSKPFLTSAIATNTVISATSLFPATKDISLIYALLMRTASEALTISIATPTSPDEKRERHADVGKKGVRETNGARALGFLRAAYRGLLGQDHIYKGGKSVKGIKRPLITKKYIAFRYGFHKRALKFLQRQYHSLFPGRASDSDLRKDFFSAIDTEPSRGTLTSVMAIQARIIKSEKSKAKAKAKAEKSNANSKSDHTDNNNQHRPRKSSAMAQPNTNSKFDPLFRPMTLSKSMANSKSLLMMGHRAKRRAIAKRRADAKAKGMDKLDTIANSNTETAPSIEVAFKIV